MKYFMPSLALLVSMNCSAQTYTVGVEQADFLPHYGLDEQSNYQGFARDVLDMFAEHAGITLVYKPLPVPDLAPALISGEIDFKYPDHPEWHPPANRNNIRFSQPVVDYVDGSLVAPRNKGQGVSEIDKLALVQGWTAQAYQPQIDASEVSVVYSEDLPAMVNDTLSRKSDAGYYNIVVALHYMNNIRAKPDVLVFDPDLPHVRSSFRLSSKTEPQVLAQFDEFLASRRADIEQLKNEYKIEDSINSEYFGLEQWKIDFLKRQKAKQQAEGS